MSARPRGSAIRWLNLLDSHNDGIGWIFVAITRRRVSNREQASLLGFSVCDENTGRETLTDLILFIIERIFVF